MTATIQKNFAELNLRLEVLQVLIDLGFETPSAI